MTAQPDVPTSLGAAVDRVSFPEAARRLAVSRSELLALIMIGRLRQVERGFVDRLDLDVLAGELPAPHERSRRDKRRLPRRTEAILWLLADWNGRGRGAELAAALEVRDAAVSKLIPQLLEEGLIRQARPGWAITTEGWEYVKQHRWLVP